MASNITSLSDGLYSSDRSMLNRGSAAKNRTGSNSGSTIKETKDKITLSSEAKNLETKYTSDKRDIETSYTRKKRNLQTRYNRELQELEAEYKQDKLIAEIA